jgi:hypothetical protein
MNIYTWKIDSIATLPSPVANFAAIIQFTVLAQNETQNSIIASISDSVQFENPLTDDSSFKPYDQLTEQEVIDWVKSTPNLVENIQSTLDAQIEFQLNPPIIPEITPLPWKNN